MIDLGPVFAPLLGLSAETTANLVPLSRASLAASPTCPD